MSIHKLTAGSGYDYLTRQVAAFDSTEKSHTGLASYYTEKGETPGTWVGSGMAGIGGLEAGDVVLSIDGKQIREFSDISRAVNSHQPGDQIGVKVRRAASGEVQTQQVTLGTRPQTPITP